MFNLNGQSEEETTHADELCGLCYDYLPQIGYSANVYGGVEAGDMVQLFF